MERDAPAIATVDCEEGLGLCVGPKAMDLAVEKAKVRISDPLVVDRPHSNPRSARLSDGCLDGGGMDQTCGVGWVVVNNGWHYGACSAHASRALAHGCIGISMTIGGTTDAPPTVLRRFIYTEITAGHDAFLLQGVLWCPPLDHPLKSDSTRCVSPSRLVTKVSRTVYQRHGCCN